MNTRGISGCGTILRSMGQARVAAEAVLLLHVLWCVWLLLGWTVTRGKHRMQRRDLQEWDTTPHVHLDLEHWMLTLTKT